MYLKTIFNNMQTMSHNTSMHCYNYIVTSLVIFNITLNSMDDWIQFNHDATGFYRVNYHPILWERLTRQLNEDHTVRMYLYSYLYIPFALEKDVYFNTCLDNYETY